MTLIDVFFKVVKTFWPPNPQIREEALRGLQDAAIIMKEWKQ